MTFGVVRLFICLPFPREVGRLKNLLGGFPNPNNLIIQPKEEIMKKASKAISVLLVIVMILSLFTVMPFSVNAAEDNTGSSSEIPRKIYYRGEYYPDYDYGDYRYFVKEDDTATIIEYRGSASNVVIPSKLDSHTVTALGYNLFNNNDNLYSVTIPDTVTDIDDGNVDLKNYYEEFVENGIMCYYQNKVTGCFAGCNNLRTVNFGRGLKYIGNFTFADCDSLVNITIPEKVTDICYGAFCCCDSLQNVEILGPAQLQSLHGSLGGFGWIPPESAVGLVEIPSEIDYAKGVFEGCKNLKKVSFSNAVPYFYSLWWCIGEQAFYGCENLTSVNIPDYITVIDDNAFYGCSSLTSVNIPDSVTGIGSRAFGGCSSLTSVTVPKSVATIGNNVFYNCTGLTSATVNSQKISNYMFQDCKALKNVTLGDNVEWVGEKAFHGCFSLKSVTIPKSVKYIGDRAFGFYYSVIGAQYQSAPYDKYFTIRGYKNTVAELYAKENGFIFTALDTSDTESKPGDADGDGQITPMDVTVVQYYFSRITTQANEETLMYADIDKNGRLEVIDTTWLLRYLAGMDDIPYMIG